MSTPTLSPVELAGRPGRPLLLLGPSLGTSAESLWSEVAAALGDTFHVVGWDLPGHGRSVTTTEPFSAAALAAAVVHVADEVDGAGARFCYAGDSVGGAIGLQLLLDAPDRVRAAALLCTGARLGTPESWAERAALVRERGTGGVVEISTSRWFAPGFVEREPQRAERLLDALRAADAEGYAQTCGLLASFDVRDRLPEVTAPVLAIGGAHDVAAPTSGLESIASGVADGRLVVLDDVAHLPPAEAPEAVAALLHDHLSAALTVAEVRGAGLGVRRSVLGAAHVERATAGTTDLTRDFQQLITQYAWGSVWTRPGLDRRSRSMITLTALVALGHHDELALHLRAAVTNGLSREEIAEVLLQSAIYCGVPAANTAFRIAQRVLDEIVNDDDQDKENTT